jgi:hypothetical protein
MRPPRDGSFRIHPSRGLSGRTIGTDSESLVLAGCLLPVAVLAHLTDNGMVPGHPAPAQPEHQSDSKELMGNFLRHAIAAKKLHN